MNKEMLKAGSIQLGSESRKDKIFLAGEDEVRWFTREDRSESDRARDWDATSDSHYISVGEQAVSSACAGSDSDRYRQGEPDSGRVLRLSECPTTGWDFLHCMGSHLDPYWGRTA